jgi:hypothetical protein
MAEKYFCCFCSINGEQRDGFIPAAGGVPMCDEHRCSFDDRARRAPKLERLASPAADPYIAACQSAVLHGKPGRGLASNAGAFALPNTSAVN